MPEGTFFRGNLQHKDFKACLQTSTFTWSLIWCWSNFEWEIGWGNSKRPLLTTITTSMQLPLYLSPDTSVAHPDSSRQLQGYQGHTGALKTTEKQNFGGASTRFLIFCLIRRNKSLFGRVAWKCCPTIPGRCWSCSSGAGSLKGQTLPFVKGHIPIITVVFSLLFVHSNHLALHSTFPSLAAWLL